ncbi:hypothetical protein KYC5002_23175 [Archangium violaceum]|uniref:RCC1 domain-containing protein n=1 Tax=Archangium violaceum TaxID=83451 RepID=UPI002B28EA6F|nr:hypothetical protein KYC5002_23175 [Archangium gephyra]
MRRDLPGFSLRFLLAGVLALSACDGGSEAGLSPDEASLGTHESAMCLGTSVSSLTLSGASTYQGDMAGGGTWTVAYPANAVRLEYYVDGALRSSDERTGSSGSWSFSAAGFTCGISNTLQVRAYPMVVDSANNRTTCWDAPRSFSYVVIESCPVIGGQAHSLAMKQDGSVWGWGANFFGQLGDGTVTQRNSPVRSGMNSPSGIASFGNHTVAVKQDGTVWAWGDNEYGELGDGTITHRYTPVQVVGLDNVITVAAGIYHSVALKQDGTVWTWGSNTYGALGDGTTTQRNTPVQVVGLNNVAAIAAGFHFTLAMKQDGTVWGWGANYFGQLGNGTTTDRLTPVQVSGLSGVRGISTGHAHSVALKRDGTVWTWGYNGYGQLGDGTATARYLPVNVPGISGVKLAVGGYYYTAVLKQDGTVWGWGDNYMGQLGDGTKTQRRTPVQVSGLGNITAITAGCNGTTLAVKQGGTVWAWGWNAYGQIGDGTTTERLSPVQVPGLSL